MEPSGEFLSVVSCRSEAGEESWQALDGGGHGLALRLGCRGRFKVDCQFKFKELGWSIGLCT